MDSPVRAGECVRLSVSRPCGMYMRDPSAHHSTHGGYVSEMKRLARETPELMRTAARGECVLYGAKLKRARAQRAKGR